MSPAPLISALGVAQIISWGSPFYAIGVLGPAMRRELGVALAGMASFAAAVFARATHPQPDKP